MSRPRRGGGESLSSKPEQDGDDEPIHPGKNEPEAQITLNDRL